MTTNIDRISQPSSSLAPYVLTTEALKSLGLSSSDIEAINQLAGKIDPDKPMTVSQFGRDVADHTTAYADNLLDQKRGDFSAKGQGSAKRPNGK